ncbi:MAG: beta-lactamase family protein [Bryobacterales bacterium]|nr:beta-lactamase family protein [Bryobacterales bacterium]
MKIILVLLLASVCGLAESGDALTRLIDKAVADAEIPSAVVLVDRGGKLVYRHVAGYADVEKQRALRGDEMFMIASTSKPFAATAIMTLVDAGKLSLDDKVTKFFPEFRGDSTIRQLLSHTSGIFGNNGSKEELNAIRDFSRPLRDAVPLILKHPLAYAPGEKYVYGGASFCVAGRIVEMITGMEFDAYMEKVLLRPLAMRNTVYRSGQISHRVPLVYSRASGTLQRMKAVMEPPDRPGPRADGFLLVPGGIYATADDALMLLRLHRANGLWNGKRVLSQEAVRQMHTKQTGKLATNYGLGWQLQDLDEAGLAQRFSHGGAYGTEIWVDTRKDLAVVVFTQMPGGEARGFHKQVQAAILAAY